ncbi:glycosyltransferase 87 family protein [Brachyspira aalborgi]|uniref:DUF2029 domain-containing protein n=1 Tax=Brachyspira aalborgi TaxID=29522 RepID=A0A5C8FGI4_9SPIR|nr:glycosyltransferase 87 family protein [Brachyspira aalborgi]TXJ49086.1 DUF2029 domain-containing protein [Brachyspira aalborgi]
MKSKNKKLFLKIYILFVIIISITLIILQILGSKNRIGYLTDFKLNVYKTLELNNLENINNELDEEGLKNFILNNENITNYIYHFRIRYYNKTFRNNDIYGVYPDLSNLPDYIKNVEMDGDGSPYGNFISDKKTIKEDKIDNINYTLKVKTILIYSLFYTCICVLIIIYCIYLYFYSKGHKNLRLSFCILMSLFFIIFFILLIIQKGGYQLNVVLNGWDLFADFYNILRYIAERNPYFNEINGVAEKIYFPIAYLILYPFSLFRDYSNMSLYEVQTDAISNLSLVIFISFEILLFFIYLNKMNKQDKYSNLIIILIFFSSIILVSIERANLAFLTSSFVVIFIIYYKSDNKIERLIGLIALGLASALKIYPVLLGFLLLQERRYKDILIGSLITLSLIFLPFLFFENGFNNIPQLIGNLKLWKVNCNVTSGGRFGLSHLFYVFTRNSSDIFVNMINLITYLLILISIVYSFFIEEYWKKILLLTLITIQFPLTGYYCGGNIFPAIILFLSKEDYIKTDISYLILFSLYLMPLQIPSVSSFIIGSVVSIILWLMILIEAITKHTQTLKNKLTDYTKDFNNLKNDIIGL